MVFESILDPIFSPLLNIPTLWAVIIMSFVISLIITIIYKYTTDQNLMKSLKEEMKAFQKQIKELKKEPEKAMAVQKQAMQTNMKYMMQSMKSTLYSFIPIILIFGWMNANFALIPIIPGEEFVTTISFVPGIAEKASISVPEGIEVKNAATKDVENNQAKWLLSGKEGEYLIEYDVDGKTYSQQILISQTKYLNPVTKINDAVVETIEVDLKKNVILPFIGFGWLGTYIIFAIIFSILIRRIIKVY